VQVTRAARVEDGRVLQRRGHQVREAEGAPSAGRWPTTNWALNLASYSLVGRILASCGFGDDGHCVVWQKGLGADDVGASRSAGAAR